MSDSCRDGKLTDVSPQHVLNLLLLEPSLDDQSPRTIYTATRPQFCKDELHDMLLAPLHPLADIWNVRKDGLLVAFT